MIATCRELCDIKFTPTKKSACGLDQGLHVVQMPLQRPPPRGGQAVLRPRDAAVERLGAGDVVRVLELAGVDAEIAVGQLEQRLELVEGERVHAGERGDDAEPHALVDQAVEIGCGAGGATRRARGLARRNRMSRCVALSHRTSVQSETRTRYANRRTPRRAAIAPAPGGTARRSRARESTIPSPARSAPRRHRPSPRPSRTAAATPRESTGARRRDTARR